MQPEFHSEEQIRFDPASEGWIRDERKTFLGSIATVWRCEFNGMPSIGILCEARHDNGWGKMHGGILMTLADNGLGAVVGHMRNPDRHAEDKRVHSPTAQLDMHFTEGVDLGDFVYSRAEPIRLTNSLTFARGTLHAGNKIVASMQGVFKALRPA